MSASIWSPGLVSWEDIRYDATAVYAAQTIGEALQRRGIYVTDYPFLADPTGVEDSTVAFQAAASWSTSHKNCPIHVPAGKYRINGLITLTQGTMVLCEGSQGSNEDYGTVFKHYSNGSLFRWDGSGLNYTGTGGGLFNCLIFKANGYTGGNALELVAQNDNQRPGEMLISNVLAYADTTGSWTRGLVIDGSACVTPGARGVRTVYLQKARFADVSTAQESILINQGTHIYADGLACDQGHGSAAGIKLKGINDGVYLSNLACGGVFEVVTNDATNYTNELSVQGKVNGSVIINDNQVDGTIFLGDTGGITCKSKRMKVISNDAPAFDAYLNATVADVTGDGTTYKATFDTEVFDNNSDWGSNTYTCKVAGLHEFTWKVLLSGLLVGHTRFDIGIVQTGSIVRQHAVVNNPYAMSTSGLCTVSGHDVLDLAYGDTVYLNISVTGGAKVVDFFGSGASTLYSKITGKYLP
jgi:hypothetical protein